MKIYYLASFSTIFDDIGDKNPLFYSKTLSSIYFVANSKLNRSDLKLNYLGKSVSFDYEDLIENKISSPNKGLFGPSSFLFEQLKDSTFLYQKLQKMNIFNILNTLLPYKYFGPYPTSTLASNCA